MFSSGDLLSCSEAYLKILSENGPDQPEHVTLCEDNRPERCLYSLGVADDSLSFWKVGFKAPSMQHH